MRLWSGCTVEEEELQTWFDGQIGILDEMIAGRRRIVREFEKSLEPPRERTVEPSPTSPINIIRPRKQIEKELREEQSIRNFRDQHDTLAEGLLDKVRILKQQNMAIQEMIREESGVRLLPF